MTPKDYAFSDMKKAGEKIITENNNYTALYMGETEMLSIGIELTCANIAHELVLRPYTAKIVFENGGKSMLIKYATKKRNIFKYFVNRSTKSNFKNSVFVGTYNAKYDTFLLDKKFVSAMQIFDAPKMSAKSISDIIAKNKVSYEQEIKSFGTITASNPTEEFKSVKVRILRKSGREVISESI